MQELEASMRFACGNCKAIFSHEFQLEAHQHKEHHRGILQFKIE